MRAHERALEEEDERDRRYGLQHDPDDEFAQELELADRITEQASLPPGDRLAHETARYLLGRGPCPYERPHEPKPDRFIVGDHVSHQGPDGPRPGRVVNMLEPDGLVEVDFGRHGTTLVSPEELGRETP